MVLKKWTVAAMVAGAALFGGLRMSPSIGAPPKKPMPNFNEEDEMKTMNGVVKSLVKNDHGDVDGFLLEDGQTVHFPPHMSEEVLGLAGRGHRITVTGRNKTRPEGERVFEAETIERNGRSVTIEPPRPKGPPAKSRPDERPMSAAGAVEEMNTNRHGDVDGFILKDGTEVKFPPHQADELSAAVKAGAKVEVEGRRHVTPKGDVHLHADRITVTSTGKTIERDEPDGPPGPRPPHAGPRDHGPEGLQREILDELRAIRRVLERQSGNDD